MALDSQSHVATVLFNDLDVDEFLTQALNDSKESTLDKDVLSNVIQSESSAKDLLSCLLFILRLP